MSAVSHICCSVVQQWRANNNPSASAAWAAPRTRAGSGEAPTDAPTATPERDLHQLSYANTHAGGPLPCNHSQDYTFAPILRAQQNKRPRRRYEEIERMYKCGWNGCEKAYGALNHLSAHVAIQLHGTKRTPEEFKED